MVHKLIHLTDPHLVGPGGRLYGLDPQARLGACLEHIAAEHGDAALCVISGDLRARFETAYGLHRRRSREC